VRTGEDFGDSYLMSIYNETNKVFVQQLPVMFVSLATSRFPAIGVNPVISFWLVLVNLRGLMWGVFLAFG